MGRGSNSEYGSEAFSGLDYFCHLLGRFGSFGQGDVVRQSREGYPVRKR
jgi:hypothetical protein